MRVLLNALQAGNRSGTGRYTIELAHALSHAHLLSELALAWPCGLPFEGADVRLLRQSASAPARLWADQWELPRRCRREAFDLLHYPANIGALFPLGCRTVVTVHDCSFYRNPEWFRPGRAVYYRVAATRSSRAAVRVIADSCATAEDIETFMGITRDRIDIVPLGISPAFAPPGVKRVQELRRRMKLPERFFLYVGTIEPRKNLARLLEAWSRHAARPDFPSLVIAGRMGWKTDRFQEAVVKHQKTAKDQAARCRLQLLDHVAQADLPVLLGAAEAFVWPSLCEGFGLPPLEAMACGVPVLTSSASSLPEVTGDAALLVNPEDTDAIADGLELLAEETSLREILKEKGMRRAQEFSWNRTAQLTVESYQRALQ